MLKTELTEVEFTILASMLNYSNKVTEKENGLFKLDELFNASMGAARKLGKGNLDKYRKRLVKKNYLYWRQLDHEDKAHKIRDFKYYGIRTDKESFRRVYLLFARRGVFGFFESDYYHDNVDTMFYFLAKFVAEVLQAKYDAFEVENHLYQFQYCIFSPLFIEFMESEEEFHKQMKGLHKSLGDVLTNIDEKRSWVMDFIFKALYLQTFGKGMLWVKIRTEKGVPVGQAFQNVYKSWLLQAKVQGFNWYNQLIKQTEEYPKGREKA